MFLGLSIDIGRKDGRSVFEIWEQNLKKYKIDKQLCKNEYEILNLFGMQLGGFDLDGETTNIENTIVRIDEYLSRINKELDKNKKIYKNLGFLSGLLIVLLLF